MTGMKLFALTLLLPTICLGDPSITDPDTLPNTNYVEDSTPWGEIAVKLPAYPLNENLVPFDVSSATANKFMIDTASISVGNDRVVRYAVVIDSPKGARTVNYEGLRCETMESKIYAFGGSDGKWTENRYAKWGVIKVRSLLSYHKALFEDVFCDTGIAITNAEEGIRKLKQAARVY